MAGLFDTGFGYRNSAVSGLVRESAQQQQVDRANMEINAQEQMAQEQEAATVNSALIQGGATLAGAALIFAALL